MITAPGQRSACVLVLAGCLALLAAGCGSDDEQEGKGIPRAQVAELDKQLSGIERRFDFGDGACGDIETDSEPSVRRVLDALPNDVDPDVRRALRESFDRLFELTREECDEGKNRPTTPKTTPEPAPETTPAPPTTTTHPETTPTQTTPDLQGNGKGKANGRGKGQKQKGENGSSGGTEAPE